MTSARPHIRPGIRQAKILEFVTRRGDASVDLLAKKFATSPETIRRDLAALADAGHIRKVHGGAQVASPQGEGFFDSRMRHNALAKRLIAEKIVALVKPRQTLFMDTGSTTLICAEALAKVKALTVITNSTRIAATFAAGSGGSDVYVLGGLYRGDNAQTVGASTLCEISNYKADIAILTVGAIDAGGGMDFSNQEAMVARAMIEASARVVVVADHSKFEKRAPFRVCGLNRIEKLVTDRTPGKIMNKGLRDAGVEVV